MPENTTRLEDLPHGRAAEAFNKVAIKPEPKREEIDLKTEFSRAASKEQVSQSGSINFAPVPRYVPRPPGSVGAMVDRSIYLESLAQKISEGKQQHAGNAVKLRKPVISLEHIEKAQALHQKIRDAQKGTDKGRDR